MEKTNSDERIKILVNLEGDEIINVCETSKEMSRVCNDERYTPLWRQKIKDEFNLTYDGPRGFDKYRELRILYNTNIYTVIVADTNESDHPYSVLFYTLEAAKNFIWSMGADEFTYMQIDEALKATDHVKIGSYRYTIETNKMSNSEMDTKPVEEQKLIAKNKTQQFYDLIAKEMEENEEVNEDAIKDGLIDTITDLNSDIENNSTATRLYSSLQRRVEEIMEENDLPDKFTNIIRNYILDSIMITPEQRQMIEKLIKKTK